MKTDAIRKCITTTYIAKQTGGSHLNCLTATINEAEAELSAIEKENTMLREKLVAIKNNANLVDELSDYSDLPDGWAGKADSALNFISNIADV